VTTDIVRSEIDERIEVKMGGSLRLVIGDEAQVAQQNVHRLGRLGANAEPVRRALLVHLDGGRLGQRVVEPDLLDDAAVTLRAAVRRHDAIARALLGSHAAKTKFDHERLQFDIEKFNMLTGGSSEDRGS
jgi:hypothetical protein